jgi:rhamnosyltransferase
MLGINCRLIDARLGLKSWIPVISNILLRPIDFEPPWKYYYIIRNSTKLLLEGRMDFASYMRQLINWGVRILLADGPRKLTKSITQIS